MQMSMRQRQIDDMHEYYMAMRDQMRMNILTPQKMFNIGARGVSLVLRG